MECSLVTVVTPSYNRASLLPRLFNSLSAQTSHDFVWLVVDDGSTDNTRSVVEQFKEQTQSFKIIYIYKENGGKHTALNVAIDYVETDLFFIVDSDDTLTLDAISTIEKDWQSVKDRHLSGISYLKGYSNDKPIGDFFLKDHVIDSFNNMRVRSHVKGDKAEVWATEYLKRLRFPVYKGERFLVESWMWVQVSDMADMLFVNKVIYLCEYLEGGLSLSGRKLRINCPNGGRTFSLLMMDRKFPLGERIKNGMLYVAYSFFSRRRVSEAFYCRHTLLTALCLIPGYLLYRYWDKKYNN